MQIGELIAVTLDRCTHLCTQVLIRVHVEQNPPRIAHQAERPVRDDERTDNTRQRVHPQPAERARQNQARNGHDRHHSVGHHVNIGRANVVITKRAASGAVVRRVLVCVLLKGYIVGAIDKLERSGECVGFRNLLHGFPVGATISAARRSLNILSILPGAAALFRRQIDLGLAGDPRAALEA